MKKTVILISTLMFPFFAQAQEQEANIEQINIQGKLLNIPIEKSSENVTVISRSEIEKSTSNTVEDLLQQTLGVDVRRRGPGSAQSDVSIRGGSFEQTMLLINGVRMNDSQTGHNSFTIPVDLMDVERIEIIKGPAARRFGNNAYAGVVNIITRATSEEKIKISAEGGDYSSYKLGLSATGGSEKFRNFFQVNSAHSDGYRHNTDLKVNSVFYSGEVLLNGGKIDMMGGFTEKNFGANGFYASPSATEQYEEVQASILSVGFRKSLGNWELFSRISHRRGQDMYLFNREKPEIYRNMHIGNNLGLEAGAAVDSKLGKTAFGTELRQEYLRSSNLGKRDRFITQFFLEHHISLLDEKLQIVPGISYANFSSGGDFFYPGLDVGYQVSPNHKVYANVARVHRIPTFTDLYYTSATEEGNEFLKPENATAYELGYKYTRSGFVFTLSGFQRDTKNGIDWLKSDEDNKWHASNIGDVKTRGIETEISKDFNSVIRNLSVGYSYLDQKFGSSFTDTRYQMDNLKHQFIAKTQNQFSDNFDSEITYRYQERSTGDSYNLVDFKFNYHRKDLTLYTLISNLTGTKYTEAFGVPMPGRWFYLGANYTIRFK